MEKVVIYMRIGHGFDAHRFGPGNAIVIGGIHIPHTQGIVAHSDGDVLIHAICDALLGALGLGDIGRHFPDNDPAFVDIPSTKLLQRVMAHLQQWRLLNLDATVIAQAPRLAEHIQAMQARLAPLLQVTPEQVNIKATTTEGMGYIGHREGLAAHAVVLLEAAI